MIPAQFRSFIYKLITATGEDEVKWQEGAENAYFATQKNANLHIRYIFDSDNGESGYGFRVQRGAGDASFAVTSDEDDYSIMRNLYSAASVSAAGGASIVDDLFD